MIKTVLFDLGNVILPFDVTRLAGRLAAYSPLSAEDILGKLWNDHVAGYFETGRMSPTEYFEHVSKECQFSGLEFDEFVPVFNAIFDEDATVVDLIVRLKKNYSLGLISNTNAIHAAYVMETYPSMGHFHRRWFSNEAGYRKPDPEIFEMALRHFETPAQNAVFIDDLAPNIAAAKSLGLNALLYRGSAQLKTDLTDLGVSL